MTVLYTETHLTSSPIYAEDGSASFSVALSSLTLQCHIHREDNIIYLKENQVIQGDLVYISGVFVTNMNETYFIKVHSIKLAKKDSKLCKKRKLEELQQLGHSCHSSDSDDNQSSTRRTSLMSITSSFSVDKDGSEYKALMTKGVYQEMDISFSQLFFILYGQATFLTEQYGVYYKSLSAKTPSILTRDQLVRTKFDLLLDIFRQIYDTSQDLSSQIKVINFVSNVRTFTEKLNELKELMPDGVLPPGVSMSKNVLLPREIFQNFTRQ